MKAASFDYVRPSDLDEAAELLAAHEGAKLLAGGQSLGPMLNLRIARPQILVDISRLQSLKRIEETSGVWRIGAGVTHAMLEDVGRLAGAEMIGDVAAGIAYRSVRNFGTVGGSLAHADPAADWPLAFATLKATIKVGAPKGASRSIAAEGFMTSAFVTALGQDEIVESIDVPKRSAKTSYGYFKFCRKSGDFPEASAAFLLDPESGECRVFVGALFGAPQSLPGIGRLIAKEGPTAASDDAVMAAVADTMSDREQVDRRMHAAAVQHAIRRAFQ